MYRHNAIADYLQSQGYGQTLELFKQESKMVRWIEYCFAVAYNLTDVVVMNPSKSCVVWYCSSLVNWFSLDGLGFFW